MYTLNDVRALPRYLFDFWSASKQRSIDPVIGKMTFLRKLGTARYAALAAAMIAFVAVYFCPKERAAYGICAMTLFAIYLFLSACQGWFRLTKAEEESYREFLDYAMTLDVILGFEGDPRLWRDLPHWDVFIGQVKKRLRALKVKAEESGRAHDALRFVRTADFLRAHWIVLDIDMLMYAQ